MMDELLRSFYVSYPQYVNLFVPGEVSFSSRNTISYTVPEWLGDPRWQGSGETTLEQWGEDLRSYERAAYGFVIRTGAALYQFPEKAMAAQKKYEPLIEDIARKILFPRHIYFENLDDED